jgi:hypothetical protein
MEIKILFDSKRIHRTFFMGWGISYLINGRIIFDIGEQSSYLFRNIGHMGINISDINHHLNESKEGRKMAQTRGLLRQVDEADSETLKRISTAWRNSAFDDMNLLRTFALRQGVLDIFLGFMRYIYSKASVEPELIEMARIKSAWLAGCRH